MVFKTNVLAFDPKPRGTLQGAFEVAQISFPRTPATGYRNMFVKDTCAIPTHFHLPSFQHLSGVYSVSLSLFFSDFIRIFGNRLRDAIPETLRECPRSADREAKAQGWQSASLHRAAGRIAAHGSYGEFKQLSPARCTVSSPRLCIRN